MTRRWHLRVLLALGVAGAGCTVGPAYHPPAPPAITAANYKESTVNFQNAPGWKVANPNANMLRGPWWQVFGDPDLNALEQRLEINNQTIQEYFENYMEARTLIAEARAAYWPTISLAPSATRSRQPTGVSTVTSATGVGAAVSGTSSQYSLPLDAAWEPDLWGKIRNEVRAAQYGAQVSAADLADEKLTEESSLAEYFFEIRGQDAELKMVAQTVAADRQALQLAQASYQTGVGDQILVVEAEAALQAAMASETDLGVARAQYEHAIAVLLGVVASNFSLPPHPETFVPPPIPTGVPSQLLERRPDVAAAERTLAEANATIGIGYGAFFPQLTITGDAGFASSALHDLLTWPSRFWSVGPSISQTLFNGGLYRAELAQYTATYNADVASYRATVLTAFQQVEDALAEVRIYSTEIGQEQAAVTAAQQSLQMEMARFQTGIDPYADVLTVQTTLLGDQESLSVLQSERMVSAVELVEALGGGWDASQLPSPKAVSAKTPPSP